MAPADECLCGTATLIEQLAQTKGISVTRVDIPAQLKGALFLVSDEHGVFPLPRRTPPTPMPRRSPSLPTATKSSVPAAK